MNCLDISTLISVHVAYWNVYFVTIFECLRLARSSFRIIFPFLTNSQYWNYRNSVSCVTAACCLRVDGPPLPNIYEVEEPLSILITKLPFKILRILSMNYYINSNQIWWDFTLLMVNTIEMKRRINCILWSLSFHRVQFIIWNDQCIIIWKIRRHGL